MAKYRTLTGLSYGTKTVEANVIVDDIPAKSIKWLREQNLIELVDTKGVAIEEPVGADPEEDEE